MLVQDQMTPDPITIAPDATFSDAFKLMKKNKLRRLPVVDRHGQLVGIVVEQDLLRVSPSSASSLSIFEITRLLSELQVEQVMSKPVITAPPELPVEEAARLMVDKKVGCLLVVRDDKLVGIITETDIFKALVEVLGGGHPSIRLTVRMADQPGQLARLAGLLAAEGANMYAVGTFRSRCLDCVAITMRLEHISGEKVLELMKTEGFEVLNLWEPSKQE